MNKAYDALYNALTNLILSGKTLKEIETSLPSLVSAYESMFPEQKIDQEQLLRDLLSANNIAIGNITIIDDGYRDHQEWYSNRKTEIKWTYWERYKQFMLKQPNMSPVAVDNIDKISLEALKRIEDPKRQGKWDRRGMVVGNVQSGKTGTYIGLICRAVDAGYKVIIVLAGLNNDLRKQTQERIDEGFLGFDTAKKARNYDQTDIKFGAGLEMTKDKPVNVHALTNSTISGDFKKAGARLVTISPGGDPVIAVVKKNVTPLKNLLLWLQSFKSQLSDVPLLLIDDEADNASIDTNATKRVGVKKVKDKDIIEKDPTKINMYIRSILNCFDKSAYVGYTATPFANIFIYPQSVEESKNDKIGEDLFPRSFIINMPSPSNYIGPDVLFGLYEDRIAGIQAKEGLPLIHVIDDYTNIIPEKHKKNLQVEEIPDSLVEAILAFIMVCAARAVRGEPECHNSMIVHVTRYADVQTQLCEVIEEELKEIQEMLEYKTGPGYEALKMRMQNIWEADFVPKSKHVIAYLQSMQDTYTPEEVRKQQHDVLTQDYKKVSWKDIEPILEKYANKIEVKKINGDKASGGLNYGEYPSGCCAIAVGGDKLSRGLTLPGLSISYYTRASKMYDTLMQMGRWFGYRPKYVDLCRLYTSSLLAKWYMHIAVANKELRDEFDDMARLGGTPENFGLKVRTHPDGMTITALNKMKNTEEKEVTFAGNLVQLTKYNTNESQNEINYLHTEDWIRSLGKYTEQKQGNYLWCDVPSSKVIEFLRDFYVTPAAFNARTDAIVKYIEMQNCGISKEITEWTVALISTQKSHDIKSSIKFADLNVNMPYRTQYLNVDDNTIFLERSNLITEDDQQLDLTQEEYDRAFQMSINANLENNKKAPEKPSPIYVRKNRSPHKALLLLYVFNIKKEKNGESYKKPFIGFAISFPDTNNNYVRVTYKIDKVYLDSIEDMEDADGDMA